MDTLTTWASMLVPTGLFIVLATLILRRRHRQPPPDGDDAPLRSHTGLHLAAVVALLVLAVLAGAGVSSTDPYLGLMRALVAFGAAGLALLLLGHTLVSAWQRRRDDAAVSHVAQARERARARRERGR